MAAEEEEIVITEEALKYARETTDQLTVFVLKDMVVSLNETKLKLLLNIKELKQQLNQQKEDQADIYFYLNKKCDDAYEIISTLEEQLLNEQTDREIAEKSYEKKFYDMQNLQQTTEIRMQAKIRDLEDRLMIVKEFTDKKEETEKLLESLMNSLETERQQFAKNIHELENKTLLEREKLKQEYAVSLSRARKEINDQLGEKVSKVTKKTQVINHHLTTEIINQVFKFIFPITRLVRPFIYVLDGSKNLNQTSEANKVLDISYKIENKDRNIRREYELLKDSEAEMINRLSTYQRIIKQQTTKITKEEEEYSKLQDSCQKQLEAKDNELLELKFKMESIERDFDGEIKGLVSIWISSINQLYP